MALALWPKRLAPRLGNTRSDRTGGLSRGVAAVRTDAVRNVLDG